MNKVILKLYEFILSIDVPTVLKDTYYINYELLLLHKGKLEMYFPLSSNYCSPVKGFQNNDHSPPCYQGLG